MAIIDEYTEENLYEVLGVKKDAGVDEITEGYLERQKNIEEWETCPWFGINKEKLERAYAVLSDSNRRDKYDTYQYYVKHRKDEKSEMKFLKTIQDILMIIWVGIIYDFWEICSSTNGAIIDIRRFFIGLVTCILSVLFFEMIYEKFDKKYSITDKLCKLVSTPVSKKNEKIRKKNMKLYRKLGLDE